MFTIIFDCDGVLADTERYGHLPVFNETFREFGLPSSGPRRSTGGACRPRRQGLGWRAC